jgi:hypothetical protein
MKNSTKRTCIQSHPSIPRSRCKLANEVSPDSVSAPVTHAARTQTPRLTSVAAKMSGALSKISKKYNKKEIFSLKAVFDEADADGSGEIDSSELRKALSKSSLSAAAVDMFKALDKDGSKRIGFDEYLKVRHLS